MKKLLLSAALLSASFGFAQTFSNPNGYFINELIASPSNSDEDLVNITDNAAIQNFLYDTDQTLEYFEFKGPIGGSFPAGTYFLTVDGDGDDLADTGRVREVLDLSGLAFGSNGILVIVADLIFATGSVDQNGVTITTPTRITNPYATQLAASGANVITVEITAEPEWTDEDDGDDNDGLTNAQEAAAPTTETLRRFNNTSIISTDGIGYDGAFNDQSNNFFLINAPARPSTNSSSNIDINNDGNIDDATVAPGAPHLDWTVYDSFAILDNDDTQTGENGEFGYAQIVFQEINGNSVTNSINTDSTVITLEDDAQYIARAEDSDGGYTADDFFAARLNSNRFIEVPFDTLRTGSDADDVIPIGFNSFNIPVETFGGPNLSVDPTGNLILSTNDFTINGEEVVAFPVPMTDVLTISGIEVDASTLYSLNGGIVATGAQTVDVAGLSNGAYILEINAEGKKALLW